MRLKVIEERVSLFVISEREPLIGIDAEDNDVHESEVECNNDAESDGDFFGVVLHETVPLFEDKRESVAPEADPDIEPDPLSVIDAAVRVTVTVTLKDVLRVSLLAETEYDGVIVVLPDTVPLVPLIEIEPETDDVVVIVVGVRVSKPVPLLVDSETEPLVEVSVPLEETVVVAEVEHESVIVVLPDTVPLVPLIDIEPETDDVVVIVVAEADRLAVGAAVSEAVAVWTTEELPVPFVKVPASATRIKSRVLELDAIEAVLL